MPFSVEFEQPVCERMTPMNTSLGRTKKTESTRALSSATRQMECSGIPPKPFWALLCGNVRTSIGGLFRRCCCHRAVAIPNRCACQQRWSAIKSRYHSLWFAGEIRGTRLGSRAHGAGAHQWWPMDAGSKAAKTLGWDVPPTLFNERKTPLHWK